MSEHNNRLTTNAGFLAFTLLALTSRGIAAAEAPAITPPSGMGLGSSSIEDAFTVGSRPDNRYLGLEESIAQGRRSAINATTRYSTQSDDVDISQQELTADFYFAEGTHRLSPGVLSVEFNPETAATVTQRSVGTSGSYRISDGAAITGALWLNHLDAKDIPSDNISTYDVYVTLWPSDMLRFDLDVKREIFDNTTSLRGGIAMKSWGLSADINPADQLRISLRAAKGDVNDGNERKSAEAEALWRVKASPDIDVGLRVSGFDFSEQLNNGYFNPEKYRAAEALFKWRSNLSDNVAAEFAASAGVEDSDPGDSKSVVKASLRVIADISDDWALDGGIAYFSSRQSSSSGFARTSLRVGVRYKL